MTIITICLLASIGQIYLAKGIVAMSFVALRFIYIYLYIADLPKARSTVWTLAFLCTMIMYLLPILP
ncbi:MAPEG family protein [Leptospira meyeri]|uniref:MAPEG family protein n=1 Tax=Leptospira meyeri TaxID=29508 RepID=UPI00223E7ABE|nr:MAPEG family protein [Leptospira meyeri]MCW7490265.1 MAPEG family protein [Leptospira meyeri]